MTIEFIAGWHRTTSDVWHIHKTHDGDRVHLGTIDNTGIFSANACQWRVELKDGRVAYAPTLSKAKLAARLLLGATGQVTSCN